MKSSVTIASASDKGRKREENQDYCSYHLPDGGLLHKKGVLLALADGMGGHSGGATASRIAIDVLMEEYYKDIDQGITESLQAGFSKANKEVIARGESDENLKGMGTTLTAAVLHKDHMHFAHVGDSRGYIIYKNEIRRFTEDHSMVANLVKAGYISEEEAAKRPDRNVITRAIGIKTKLKPDISLFNRKLKIDQYVMLCCDGLHGVVPDEEMLEITNQYDEPGIICEKLVEKANEYGGPDNITVVMARVDRLEKSPILEKLKDLLR